MMGLECIVGLRSLFLGNHELSKMKNISMNIDIEDLKRTSEEAIATGNRAYLDKLAAADLQKSMNVEAARLFAQAVIKKIPGLLKNQAEQGKRKCCVFESNSERHSLSYEAQTQYKPSFKDGVWYVDITFGPGLLIKDACEKAGLKVSCIQGHDGGGMDSWADVWVHW